MTLFLREFGDCCDHPCTCYKRLGASHVAFTTIHGHAKLFSTSVTTGTEKTIATLGREHLPESLLGPALHLTPTPDSKSLTYSTVKTTSNLWLLEGRDTVALP